MTRTSGDLSLQLRNGRWHVVGTMNGVRVRYSTRIPERDRFKAEVELAHIRKHVEDGHNAKIMTFFEVCQAYVKTSKTADKELYRIERIERFVGDVPIYKVNRSTAKALEDFFREECGLMENTICRELNVFAAIMNFAHFEGWANKITFRRNHVNDARDRYMDKHERDGYLKEVKPKLLPIFMLLLFTGARLGEVLALRFDDVTKAGVKYTSRKGKGKVEKTRIVPLRADVKSLVDDVLRRHRWQSPGVERYDYKLRRIFPYAHKTIWDEHHRVCDKLGIKDLRIHDLRHTFASLLAMEGASELTLMELLGHSSVQMVARYVKLNNKHKMTVLDKL